MIDKMKEVAMKERDQHEGIIEEKNREINHLIENKNREVSNVIQDRKRSLDEKSKEVSKIHHDKEKEIKKLAEALSDLKEELVQSSQLNLEFENKKRSLETKLDNMEKEAEKKERIEEECSPGASSGGGEDSQPKEDIDPRNVFTCKLTPIFPLVSTPGDLEIKLLRARLEQTEKTLETLLSQMAAKQLSTVRKVQF